MSNNLFKILTTRAVENSIIALKNGNKIHLQYIPFIETKAIENDNLNRAINEALVTKNVVFTSLFAAEIVFSIVKNELQNCNIFCVGNATSQFIKKHLGNEIKITQAKNATELAHKILETSLTKITFFCGNIRRNELPNLLKENNIDVQEIIIYETFFISQKINEKYDALLFFSPSAVQSFFTENKIENTTVLFSIGTTTSNEIKKHTSNTIYTSSLSTQKDVLKITTDYFKNKIK